MGRDGDLRHRLNLHNRLYLKIRDFFAERGVLEVVTPLLGSATVSDPHIESLVVDSATGETGSRFLQTSPEFAMKQLLAAGSGPIFQICKAFRAGETGKRHNPEFSMLEWYQPGYQLETLIEELLELFETLARRFDSPFKIAPVTSYKALFVARFDLDPHTATTDQLFEIAQREFPSAIQHIKDEDEGTIDDLRDVLFSLGIEPSLQPLTVVTSFPATQAALAKLVIDDGQEVAGRFEVYWQGVELANGYDELTDGAELARRIDRHNRIRRNRSLKEVAPDLMLLSAMEKMPDCAGVAVGLDRLLMLLTGADDISEIVRPDLIR